MPVPDFQSIMLPMLKAVSDGKPHTRQDVRDRLIDEFKLTSDDLAHMLPSGRHTTFRNRVSWAQTHLLKAGLVASPSRGMLIITEAGKATLASGVSRVDIAYLRQFPSFNEFRALPNGDGEGQREGQTTMTATVPANQPGQEQTPDEVIDATYVELRRELEAQLLEQVRGASPRFFEQVVVDLLVKMGYGGSARRELHLGHQEQPNQRRSARFWLVVHQ